ncbi:putative secreted protein, SVM family protein [Candidatus Phytoplasma solani]
MKEIFSSKKPNYLHFNPKQGYITLYTKKFNTKTKEQLEKK